MTAFGQGNGCCKDNAVVAPPLGAAFGRRLWRPVAVRTGLLARRILVFHGLGRCHGCRCIRRRIAILVALRTEVRRRQSALGKRSRTPGWVGFRRQRIVRRIGFFYAHAAKTCGTWASSRVSSVTDRWRDGHRPPGDRCQYGVVEGPPRRRRVTMPAGRRPRISAAEGIRRGLTIHIGILLSG